MKKTTRNVLLSVFLITVILNILAWTSTAFCDWYVAYVYPIWNSLMGRISSLFPFSVGEFLIVVGVVWIVATIVLTLTTFFYNLMKKHSEITCKLKKINSANDVALLIMAVFLVLIQTLNCFIMYHTSPFDEKYNMAGKEDYTLEELASLRDYVVEQVNELSKQVKRDEFGTIIYTGNMEIAAIESMRALGEEYSQLKGYYPTPKKMTASAFVSQQYMQGYYFPFSMEANYNDMMNIMKKPATMCHELAHTKGFLLEDEANLIGFLACINSEDVVFRYSGYLSVLNYIDNDYYASINKNKEIYNTHVKISEKVKRDNEFLTKETWKQVDQKAVIKTATVKTATEKALTATLVMNGIEEGALSYGKVVGLLLDYYDGIFRNEMQQEYLAQN